MARKVTSEAGGKLLASTVPATMTYEEFLAWADEDIWAEWVDGKVVVLTPASNRHQELVGFLTVLLWHYVEAHGLGVVRSAPFQMKTGPDLPGREPDILFIARQHLDRLQDTHLAGPADLAVEIVSPESRVRDRGEKFYEYEQGGVREYWLIDNPRRQAEFYRRDDDGTYRLVPLNREGVFRSVVLAGLWLRVEWLWQDPLPPLLHVLREWQLV
jgi:Uma2 family endonuclease